jgi:hypothetical protein
VLRAAWYSGDDSIEYNPSRALGSTTSYVFFHSYLVLWVVTCFNSLIFVRPIWYNTEPKKEWQKPMKVALQCRASIRIFKLSTGSQQFWHTTTGNWQY